MEKGNLFEEIGMFLGIISLIVFIYWFVKLIMQNKRLKADAIECEIELNQIKKKNRQSGAHLLLQPFMPDYLGFTFTRIRDKKTDIFQADVYTKEGFNIGRHIETDKPEWIILDPTGGKTEIKIDNMYQAIVLLQSLGLKISIEDYLAGRI